MYGVVLLTRMQRVKTHVYTVGNPLIHTDPHALQLVEIMRHSPAYTLWIEELILPGRSQEPFDPGKIS